MLRVDGYAVLSQIAVKFPPALAVAQALHERLALADGDVHRDRGAVDEMEALRDGAEGKEFRLHQGQYAVDVLRFLALQIQQGAEIGMDGLAGADVLEALQHHPPRADGSFEKARRAPFLLEERDDAFFRFAFSFAIASSRGLQ